ncbi:hypothetical protein QYM36_009841 [Artemia franciscana]|uniref:WW domain-containing protein n=1 Tax=Artemia franciscana TaxID=6661 RepID=A0AA88HPR5_ARTSF|nr:hypothetical protein QYM36_009841 [Artemia franciscana]
MINFNYVSVKNVCIYLILIFSLKIAYSKAACKISEENRKKYQNNVEFESCLPYPVVNKGRCERLVPDNDIALGAYSEILAKKFPKRKDTGILLGGEGQFHILFVDSREKDEEVEKVSIELRSRTLSVTSKTNTVCYEGSYCGYKLKDIQKDVKRLLEAKQLIPMEFYTTRPYAFNEYNLNFMLPPNNKAIPLIDLTPPKFESIEFNIPPQSQITFVYNCYTKCDFKRLAVIFDEKDEDSNAEIQENQVLNEDTATFLDGLNRNDGSITISISSATKGFGIELVGKTSSGRGVSILLTFLGTYMKLKLKEDDKMLDHYYTKYDPDFTPHYFLQRVRESDNKDITSVVLFYNYRISFNLDRGKFLTSVWSFKNQKIKKPLLAGFETDYKCRDCKINKIVMHSQSEDSEEVKEALETKDYYEEDIGSASDVIYTHKGQKLCNVFSEKGQEIGIEEYIDDKPKNQYPIVPKKTSKEDGTNFVNDMDYYDRELLPQPNLKTTIVPKTKTEEIGEESEEEIPPVPNCWFDGTCYGRLENGKWIDTDENNVPIPEVDHNYEPDYKKSFENPNYQLALDPILADAFNSNAEPSLNTLAKLSQLGLDVSHLTGMEADYCIDFEAMGLDLERMRTSQSEITTARSRRIYAKMDVSSMGVDVDTGPVIADKENNQINVNDNVRNSLAYELSLGFNDSKNTSQEEINTGDSNDLIDSATSDDKTEESCEEDLPAGWERHEDSDGPYYWHVKSGTIQRDPPTSSESKEAVRQLVRDAESLVSVTLLF